MDGLKRVVLVTNIPTPYRIPLFNELNRQLTEAGYSFCVVFGGKTYSRRKWEVDLEACTFSYKILGSQTIQLGKSNEHVAFAYSGLGAVLKELNPDLLIVPGFSLATVKALGLFIRRKCKYIIWTGSIGGERPKFDRWFKMSRRLLARYATAAVVYGTRAGNYVKTLGMRGPKIFTAINTVDTSFFEDATRAHRQKSPQKDRKYLTYIGALSPGKNVMKLLEVVRELARSRKDFCLEIVGDGEEKERLETFVATEKIEDVVRFQGYQQKQDVPEYLARSNAFLFQTDYDVWGLVLNEAMAAGVPCLVSHKAGASEDLVQEGETGFTVDFSDVSSVVPRINWILDNPQPAYAMGEKARTFIVEHANLNRSARGFVDAVQYAFHDVKS